MPLQESRRAKSPSPLSDSVELGDVPLAAPTRGAGWLDAVHGARAQAAAAAAAGVAASPAPHSPGADRGGRVATALLQSAQSEAHTPASMRNAAEVTAVGSPIPVEADDSDAHLQQLLSRVGQLAAVEEAASASATPPGPSLGPTPVPAPRPAAAGSTLHQMTVRPPPPPPPSSPPSPAPSRVVPQAMPAPSSQLGGCALMHSPFGDSHVAASSAAHTASQWHSANDGDATATMLTSGGAYARAVPQPSSTAYSSALMQALSRTEGAAALTSQWTSATHHATSTAYYMDEDSERGGSAEIPPDMYEEAMRAKVAKQQWMALEKARQEVLEEARRRRDCPFAPRVSPYAARMQRPASLRPENRVSAELIRRKQWKARKQQEEVERELQACTFRPLTLRTARLDPAALEPPRTGTGVFHHLYTDAEDRRTFEREVKPELLNQLDNQRRPSPVLMRPTELAEVLGRLCSRGAVRSSGGGGGGAPVPDAPAESAGVPAIARLPSPAPMHQPVLSSETQRIVAAQRAAGERDDDIVAQLYRRAERDAVHQRLKRELDVEQERVARAEQAVAIAQERKRLQREYYRSVLAAKYRVLAQHAATGQRAAYRATAPHSVVQLARAALDVLSADETEELLGAVEFCGQQRLTEAEFVAVVLQHLSQQRVAPAHSALLSSAPPPPPSVPRAGSGKRAGSATGGAGSADSSPTALPQVKREKPDPEVIAHVRARRAEALEEWKQEHERQRAVCEGVLADGAEYTFQPAPRRLIPYDCRPDVTVPVKTTKSEALRRAYVSARLHGGSVPATMETLAATAATTLETETRGTARALFSHRQGHAAPPPPPAPATRARSQSTAAARSQSTQRERSAAAASPARGASVSRPPRKAPAEASLPADPSRRPAVGSAKRASYASTVSPPPVASQPQAPAPSGAPATAAASASHARPEAQPDVLARRLRAVSQTARSERAGGAPSLVEQIMHSSAADRARLGRELLMRQLREHQRRSGEDPL